MDSFAQEIQGFSKSRLKKQCTHVTTVTGKRHVERRVDGVTRQIVEIEEPSKGFGFVEDKTPDLQVGVVRPFLLLGVSCAECCIRCRESVPRRVDLQNGEHTGCSRHFNHLLSDRMLILHRPSPGREGRRAGALQRWRITLCLHCDWLSDAPRRAVI